MAFISNTGFSCFGQSANVGKPDCDFNPADMEGFFLVPFADALTQVEVDDIADTIQARCIHNFYAQRWHLVGKLENVEDKSEEATESEVGNKGRKVITDEGQTAVEVSFLDGGFEHMLDLRTFNHKTSTYKIVPFDKNGVLYMRKNTDGKYEGLKMDEFYVRRPKMTAPKSPLVYFIYIRFAKGEQLLSELRVVKTEKDIVEDINTVSDVTLTNVSASLPAGVFDVTAFDHSVNLATTIGSVAAVNTVFLMKRKSTSNLITLSAVATTTVGSTPAYKLTASTIDPDYTAGQTAIIYWAPVSVLAGINDALKYFETNNTNPEFSSGQLEVVLT